MWLIFALLFALVVFVVVVFVVVVLELITSLLCKDKKTASRFFFIEDRI